MSSRKKRKEIYFNGKLVVGSMEAAKILTRRAGETDSPREYSRDTIYKHYTDGQLEPALETPAGNLYYAEDIEKLPINPKLGRHPKDKGKK